MEDFPYWDRLHGYWRTLPNFNPVTVTSSPGQDLEDSARALFGQKPIEVCDDGSNSLAPEELAELEADPDADADGEEDDGGDDGDEFMVCFLFYLLNYY